jgi:hypothetical protein
MGTGILSPRSETDHSRPSSGEVKNSGALPPLPHTYSWRDVRMINECGVVAGIRIGKGYEIFQGNLPKCRFV